MSTSFLVMSGRDYLKPISCGHGPRRSIDTNASAIAESTISLDLSRFPEPPSSTPSTPLRSEFGGTPSPIRTNFAQSVHSNSPQPLSMHAARSNPSNLHADSRGHSFKPNSTSFYAPHAKDNVPGSFQTPSAYDSNGTSTIDVDTTERVLYTSFIASLSQENKAQRRIECDTMSGISEMTYPPLDIDDALYTCNSSGRPLPASIQAREPFNRISGDSDFLHFQGQTPIIRTASVSRGVFSPGASVVGFAPATLCNVSDTKRSTVDALSIDKSLHHSTYEFSDDLSDSKTLDSLSSFLPTGMRGALRGKPAEPHFKATVVVDPAPTSLLSRISGISLRSWKKNKPLPALPDPRTTGYTHRRREESASLSELISRAVALRDLLGKDQNRHSDVLSARSSAPYSVQGTGGLKPETLSMATASHLSLSPTILSAKHQPAAIDVSASRKKKTIYFLIFFFPIVAITAIGVGVSVASRQKQRLPACMGNFTGVACNLGNDFRVLPSFLISLINIPDATCVCTSSAGCNGLAQAVVDLIPMVNQNFATNISLTSAYNSLWIKQGSPTTSNCASQALLVDIGKDNDENLYPNHTQWAQTALLWNAIQTEDVDAAGQLQQFVQKISWTSLGTTDGSLSTVAEPGFSKTVAGYIFNFASQTVTPPSASFVTLGQPTNAQISRVSSQTLSTLDRMYAFAQGMFLSQYLNCSTQTRENSLLNPASDCTENILVISATPTPTRPCNLYGRTKRLASLITFQRIVTVNSNSLLKFNFFLVSTSSGVFSRSEEPSSTANQFCRNWRLWFTTDCE